MAKSERVVLMCAEAVPWRCHRSLIADALLVRGIAAREITSAIRVRSYVLTPWARVKGTQITYPGATEAHLSRQTDGARPSTSGVRAGKRRRQSIGDHGDP
jgi:hypothetical protein